MIGFVNPKILEINTKKACLKIKLRRRTRNHLQSMYFGALCVGFDLAAGMLVLYLAELNRYKISFAFKSVKIDFIKRPYSDVVFDCNEGLQIQELLIEAEKSRKRLNKQLQVNSYNLEGELVATCIIEASVKLVSK